MNGLLVLEKAELGRRTTLPREEFGHRKGLRSVVRKAYLWKSVKLGREELQWVLQRVGLCTPIPEVSTVLKKNIFCWRSFFMATKWVESL